MTNQSLEVRPTPESVASQIRGFFMTTPKDQIFKDEIFASDLVMASFAELGFNAQGGAAKALKVLVENRLENTALSKVMLMHEKQPISSEEAESMLSDLSDVYPFDNSGLINKFVIMIGTLGQIAPATARAMAVGYEHEVKGI